MTSSAGFGSVLSADALLERLDPEQREVATSFGGPVVVIAGAGTGKTRAITHRIAYGVASGVYNPTSVLAVTFTTRAAGEMRGRLQQLGVRGVQARTFHSAALRQAQYFWPKAYGSDLPPVIDNRWGMVAEAASRLRVSTETAALRDLTQEIGWAKVSNVTPDTYASLAGRHERRLASFDAETVARVFASYEEVKRERQRIDFEDILLCTAAMISDHDRVAAEIRRTYRHLVVDEYQDVSPLQQTLLDLWRGESSDVCVVGDPAQTIHTFAGAQASFLTGFARRHPGSTVVRLVRDYRSTPQIVRVANRVAGSGPTPIGAVQLESQCEPGPEPLIRAAADEASEAAEVADWLAGLHRAGVSYRDLAILFRINAQSPQFEQALTERGIPYLVRGGERFYERPEVRQALVALRSQVRNAAEVESEPRTAAGEVKILLGSLGWTEQPPTGTGAVRERWESLAALVAVAEDLSRNRPGCTLVDVVTELQHRAEAQQVPSADGVTVSTLHSAKGLEWDGVAVVGASEGSLPFVLANTPEQVDEERRLFYVGVTRARKHLRVSWARTRDGSGQRNPSRFLSGLDGAAGGDTGANGRSGRARQARSSVLAATCRSCGRHLVDAAERKLGRHQDCPASYDEPTLERLRTWRRGRSEAERVPAYVVFTDATLMAIAEARPRTARELIKVAGIGAGKISKYGPDVLEVVNDQAESGATGGPRRADKVGGRDRSVTRKRDLRK